jgi:hypothetical protein
LENQLAAAKIALQSRSEQLKELDSQVCHASYSILESTEVFTHAPLDKFLVFSA